MWGLSSEGSARLDKAEEMYSTEYPCGYNYAIHGVVHLSVASPSYTRTANAVGV